MESVNESNDTQTARFCMDCHTLIYECMGYVLASDFLRALDGQLQTVRERCGRCVEVLELKSSYT